jgi:glycine betaine/choline ABC-type transport system substrate-binding protein
MKNDQIMIKTSKYEFIYEKNVYDFDLVLVRKKLKKKQLKMLMKIKTNGRIKNKKCRIL